MDSIRNFDFELQLDVDLESLVQHQPLIEMLQSIRSDWVDVSLLQAKAFNEGITNRLISFLYDNDAADDKLLVRIYGQNTDKFIDRKEEIKTLIHLHKNGLASEIYSTFKNGICYGFTAGNTISYQEVATNNELTRAIATEMARLHVIGSSREIEGPKTACLPYLLNKFLVLLSKDDLEKKRNERPEVYESVPSKDCLELEVSEICSHLTVTNSPIVFCHNDLLMKNIIYEENNKSVKFIDFEYGDFNYQAFDIANHFCEYQEMEPMRPEQIPDAVYQKEWLFHYLASFKCYKTFNCVNLVDEVVREEEVDNLYRQVCKCQLASHLLWGIWALLQSQYSTIDFDFGNYGATRIKEYFKRKNEFLHV